MNRDANNIAMIYENMDPNQINTAQVFDELENNPPHDTMSILQDYNDEILTQVYSDASERADGSEEGGSEWKWYQNIMKHVGHVLGDVPEATKSPSPEDKYVKAGYDARRNGEQWNPTQAGFYADDWERGWKMAKEL